MSRTRWATGLLAAGFLVLSGCSGGSDSAPTASPTNSDPPTPVCAEGAPDRPTEISRLTLDGVTAQTFATTLTVPYAGLDSGPLDRPSVVRAAVVTAESGAPVTFRASSGRLIESLDDPWLDAPSQITVYSVPGTSSCIASVYLLSTRVGSLTLSVESEESLSTDVEVVTSPAAARNVDLELEDGPIQAGEEVEVGITVTDAFGNRVVNSAVVISVPRDGPALYLNGANRATVLTDERGRARVVLLTIADRGTRLAIRARGDNPACDAGINQFDCAANQPFAGAEPAKSNVRKQIRIRQPEVLIESPPPGLILSAGDTFDLRARTLGVESGTLAQVKLGDDVLSLGSVEDGDSLSMSNIPALLNSDGAGYGLLVGSLARVPIEITVLPFGILDAGLRGEELRLRIATGAWQVGTRIELLLNGAVIDQRTVAASGEEWFVDVENLPGVYTVRARRGDEIIAAPDPLVWPR